MSYWPNSAGALTTAVNDFNHNVPRWLAQNTPWMY